MNFITQQKPQHPNPPLTQLILHPQDDKKTCARRIKFHQKHFIESIAFDKIKTLIESDQADKNIVVEEIRCFQINPETEVACKYAKALFKTQYSEILVQNKKKFDRKTENLILGPAQPYQSQKEEKS